MRLIVEFAADGKVTCRVPEGEPVPNGAARAALQKYVDSLGADGSKLFNQDGEVESHVGEGAHEGVHAHTH